VAPLSTPKSRARIRYAYVILALLTLLTSGASTLFSAHQIDTNNHKFCQVITGFTATPVPKPTSPKQHAVTTQYEWHQRFVQLGRSLGC
jgi:hypothetical protein